MDERWRPHESEVLCLMLRRDSSKSRRCACPSTSQARSESWRMTSARESRPAGGGRANVGQAGSSCRRACSVPIQCCTVSIAISYVSLPYTSASPSLAQPQASSPFSSPSSAAVAARVVLLSLPSTDFGVLEAIDSCQHEPQRRNQGRLVQAQPSC